MSLNPTSNLKALWVACKASGHRLVPGPSWMTWPPLSPSLRYILHTTRWIALKRSLSQIWAIVLEASSDLFDFAVVQVYAILNMSWRGC